VFEQKMNKSSRLRDDGGGRISCIDRHLHRHTGFESLDPRLVGFKNDLHRKSLNNFDPIAGRVFRREKLKTRSSPGLKALYTPTE